MDRPKGRGVGRQARESETTTIIQRIRCEPVVGEGEGAISDLGKGRKERENEEDGKENGERGGFIVS